MTIRQIAEILQVQLPPSARPETEITHLQLDSRQINYPECSLFFALKGIAHDGHQFVGEAYRKGIRYFVLEQPLEGELPEDACLFFVPDSLAALQDLAAAHRREIKAAPIFGITGSNGKTVVKEWLYQLLEPDFSVLRSPRSYNSQTGVPLSVWRLEEKHQIALFEAGISEMGKMKKLARIIAPTHGVFTALGPAHDAGFPDRETKLQEKLNLFETAHTIYYNSNDVEVAQALKNRFQDKRLLCWGMDKEKADLLLLQTATGVSTDEREKKESVLLTACYKNSLCKICIPFSDKASIENAMLCWLVLLDLGLNEALIAERMARLEPVAMRMEVRAAVNGSILINDAYNSDLSSLEIALYFLKQQGRGLPSLLVLTDILQSGLKPDVLYQKVAHLLAEQAVEELIGIGSEIKALQRHLPKGQKADFYPDTDSLLRDLQIARFAGKAILLKGARKFHLEALADRLAEKVHQTVLEINLDALTHNLSCFQQMLRQQVQMLVMVKAAAYGSGAAEIARLLEKRGVAYLGVAYADEGLALREAGIHLPIMVMNPEAAAFPQMLEHQLEPEIYSPALLKAYLEASKDEQNPPGIHLKLETGMHRLGLEEEMLPEVVELLAKNPQVKVQSIFSHLAASEEEKKDDFSLKQKERFVRMYEALSEALGYRPLAHLLNSEGIARFPDWQFDMVRLGIGFYGISVNPSLRRQLQPALCLKARISQLKKVAAGEAVGYGAEARSDRDRLIATISIGYADGLHRKAGQGRFSLLVRGQKAPTVGRICMDMCMIEVSAIEGVEEGDEVLVFGPEHPIYELAEALETIPYEVITGISQRVKRVYLKD